MLYSVDIEARFKDGMDWAKQLAKDTDGAAGTATPAAVSHEQNADVKEALLNAQELLGKSNGTCNNSCHCAIA